MSVLGFSSEKNQYPPFPIPIFGECFVILGSIPPIQAELVRFMAFISMMMSFMQSDHDGIATRIDHVEAAARLIHVVLQTVGDARYVASLIFLWKGLTVALMEMESKYFPGQPKFPKTSTAQLVGNLSPCLS